MFNFIRSKHGHQPNIRDIAMTGCVWHKVEVTRLKLKLCFPIAAVQNSWINFGLRHTADIELMSVGTMNPFFLDASRVHSHV
jgi:hypothetical protein